VFAVAIVWVLGAALGLARVARACAVAPGRPAAPSPARARRLERAIASTNVPPARLVVVADGTVPHTAGLVHPRIHVPIAVMDELTVAELRAVLLHENAHRVRRDPLLSLALGIVGAVFFFYPIAAFLGRRLREAAELVCDEAAIRGGASPAALASGLACVVRLSMSRSPQLASPVLGGSLSRRLDRLDTIRRKRPTLRHFSLVLLALAIVLAASAAPLVTAEEKPDVEVTKPPTVIHQVAPEMPESALADRTEGRVALRVTVAKTGEPRDVLVEQGVEGRPEFENAALGAMSQWKFTPAEADGEVVEMQILVPFLFRHDH
jgi:TonB family protein